MNAAELGHAFLNHMPIPGVFFEHHDPVRVIAGLHVGKSGSLVTLLSLNPDPLFILELESRHYVEVNQSELTRANS